MKTFSVHPLYWLHELLYSISLRCTISNFGSWLECYRYYFAVFVGTGCLGVAQSNGSLGISNAYIADVTNIEERSVWIGRVLHLPPPPPPPPLFSPFSSSLSLSLTHTLNELSPFILYPFYICILCVVVLTCEKAIAALGLSLIVAPPLGGWLDQRFGYWIVFAISVGILTLNTAYCLFILPESLQREHRKSFLSNSFNPFRCACHLPIVRCTHFAGHWNM